MFKTKEDKKALEDLKILLYKLGIKSAKLTSLDLNTLNSLFKQVYATGINDLVLGSKPALFGIDPVTYNTWKNNGKTTT